MKIELIGEIAEYYGEQNPDLAQLPKKGIVLSATEDELQSVRFPKMQGELALVPVETARNAAKLHDALKVANETADELLKWIWNNYQELNCMGSRLKRAIEGVLAAPPRNCDSFNSGDPVKDADDAYAEWQRWCDAADMPPSCKVESSFRQWLFATAKPNAKGATDGSK